MPMTEIVRLVIVFELSYPNKMKGSEDGIYLLQNLFFFLFFVILLLLFVCSLPFFPTPCGLQDLGSQAGGHVWAPVVGVLSPNRWTNRESQTPGNINRSEVSQRSSSQHQDPGLPNCLQTPVLDASGQTTSKTGTQTHPLKKKIKMTKKYVTN